MNFPPLVSTTGITTPVKPNTNQQNPKEKDHRAEVKTPWVDVIKEYKGFQNGFKLRKIQGEGIILDEKDMTRIEEVWGICAVGYVMGKYPGYRAIEEVRKTWNVPHQFYIHESGWMVFKFQNEEDRDRVLLGGPYETYGAPWLMKMMPPYFNFGDDCFTKIPTWVRLPSLPLECWNERALSKICSYIGEPLASDQCTARRLRFAYARVLVEVDVTKDLVKEFDFFLPNGKQVNQSVIYEHEPIQCGKCHKVGHSELKCKTKAQKRTGRSRSRARRMTDNSRVENSMRKISDSPHTRLREEQEADGTTETVTGRNQDKGKAKKVEAGKEKGEENLERKDLGVSNSTEGTSNKGKVGQRTLTGKNSTSQAQPSEAIADEEVRTTVQGDLRPLEPPQEKVEGKAFNQKLADQKPMEESTPNTRVKGKEKVIEEELSSVDASQWSNLWRPIGRKSKNNADSLASFCRDMTSEDDGEEVETKGVTLLSEEGRKDTSSRKVGNKKKNKGKKGGRSRSHF